MAQCVCLPCAEACCASQAFPPLAPCLGRDGRVAGGVGAYLAQPFDEDGLHGDVSCTPSFGVLGLNLYQAVAYVDVAPCESLDFIGANPCP